MIGMSHTKARPRSIRNPGTCHGFNGESKQKKTTLEALGETEMCAGTGRSVQGLIGSSGTGILYFESLTVTLALYGCVCYGDFRDSIGQDRGRFEVPRGQWWVMKDNGKKPLLRTR
jgi:hypothetical protein